MLREKWIVGILPSMGNWSPNKEIYDVAEIMSDTKICPQYGHFWVQ